MPENQSTEPKPRIDLLFIGCRENERGKPLCHLWYDLTGIANDGSQLKDEQARHQIYGCCTSPPYYQLRSYLRDDDPRKHLELGQEATPQEYIQNLVSVFREVYRVLADNGTVWLNLNDSYAKQRIPTWKVKTGELLAIPWRTALALQEQGWYLRTDIIWHAPNKMPESVKNRPSRSHEFLFLLTKSNRYFYDVDATREPITSAGGACFGKQRHSTEGTGAQSRRLKSAAERNHPLGKNKRTVWKIPVRSFPSAHFAVFPKDLVRPCILAGCPKGQKVLDPFAGSGTVGQVAEELGRDAVLIELNPVYVEMQKGRHAIRGVLKKTPPEEEEVKGAQPGWLF